MTNVGYHRPRLVSPTIKGKKLEYFYFLLYVFPFSTSPVYSSIDNLYKYNAGMFCLSPNKSKEILRNFCLCPQRCGLKV